MAKVAVKKQQREEPAIVRPRPTIPVQDVIRWVSEARPDKDIGLGMTFYSVRDGEIRATNGNITASHPWFTDDTFLVSGLEFEKILARMAEPEITFDSETSNVVISSDKFTATIDTLPPDTWAYHGVQDADWRSVPVNFIEVLKSLRVFLIEKPSQLWMTAIALENDYCYATNGMSVAGSACEVGAVQALLPPQAVDFILRRPFGLVEWACNARYAAFLWSSGAWMRTKLVEGKFSEKAAAMVRDAYEAELTQEITDQFREAFADVAALAEDGIHIFSDRIESTFKKSKVVASIDDHEVPPDREETYIDDRGRPNKRVVKGGELIFGAGVLAPVIAAATHWSPGVSPKLPAPWRGDNIAGLVSGRTG